MFESQDVFGGSGSDPVETGTPAETSTATPESHVAPGDPGYGQEAQGTGTSVEEWEVPGIGRVNREELIRGYLRQQDYTRKTQSVAGREREFGQLQTQAQQMEAALHQVKAFLSDRNKLQAYLAQLPGGEPQYQPDQILTTAEVQQLMQAQTQRSQQEMFRQMQQMREETLQSTYQTQYEQAIDNRLRSIQEKHPELVRVPGMEMLLRQAVGSQKPTTIDDALSLFDQAAAFYSERLKGLAKTVATQPNNPLNRGIQPPSTGAPVSPGEPTNFSGVKDPGLRNLVLRDLEALVARSSG